jgi:hypothetical protein
MDLEQLIARMIHRKQLTARRFTAGQFTGGAIHRKQLIAG